jgi:hypothetical protein
LFFTGSGYSQRAREFADDMNIALFHYRLDGSVEPVNRAAHAIAARPVVDKPAPEPGPEVADVGRLERADALLVELNERDRDAVMDALILGKKDDALSRYRSLTGPGSTLPRCSSADSPRAWSSSSTASSRQLRLAGRLPWLARAGVARGLHDPRVALRQHVEPCILLHPSARPSASFRRDSGTVTPPPADRGVGSRHR